MLAAMFTIPNQKLVINIMSLIWSFTDPTLGWPKPGENNFRFQPLLKVEKLLLKKSFRFTRSASTVSYAV